MINPTAPVFPTNVLIEIQPYLAAIDVDLNVFRRPLRPSDPSHSIGIFGNQWLPNVDSFEFRGVAPEEPTLQQYVVGIQAFIKDGEEERGLAAHSVLSHRVRMVLYRNPDLQVELRTLSVTYSGATERLKKWQVRTQRYMSNEVNGKFIYLSTLEFHLETETKWQPV